MVQKFSQRFDIEVDLDEARRRFLNRVYNTIFNDILYTNIPHDIDGPRFIELIKRGIITEIGERYATQTRIVYYIDNNFLKTLHAIEAYYGIIANFSAQLPDYNGCQVINDVIQSILETSEVDLCVRWQDGMFLKSGAKLLDNRLVNDVLHWIKENRAYDSVSRPYEKGLRLYLDVQNYPDILTDVITDMYEALEALSKIITQRPSKDLSANYELFIKKINISDSYKPLLKAYIHYANKFRHAMKPDTPRPKPSERETESFIYLTGIFIRLAMKQPYPPGA